MTERRRFYLTTAIAYANNRPGLHTLYEVVGADVIARWHRMLGDDTRFLTGTDEYSVNIATTAAQRGLEPKAFVDEMVALFRTAEDALGISPDRFIRTTDPDHTAAVHEMIRRAHANGDIYLGDYEGWYCPNEGFRNTSDLIEDERGVHCPNHPDVELQWLTERNWFFRLSSYQERLERHYAEHPDWVEPEYRKNEMLGFIRQGLEDFSVSREGATWGIPFPLLPDGSSAQRPDGTWDSAAGHRLRLVRRARELHHRRRLPGRPGGLRALVAGGPAGHRQGHQPAAHHLLAGHAHERRAAAAAQGLGPRLAAGPGRAHEQEPRQLPRSGGRGGGARSRRRALRGPARGRLRPRQRRLVGVLRAPLQRRPRQRLRQPAQPHADHDRALPGRRAAGTDRWRAGRGLGGHLRTLRRAARVEPPAPGPGDALGLRRPGQPLRGGSPALEPRQGGSRRGRRRPRLAWPGCWATWWRPVGSSPWPWRPSCRRRPPVRPSRSAWATRTARTATAGRRCPSWRPGAPRPPAVGSGSRRRCSRAWRWTRPGARAEPS